MKMFERFVLAQVGITAIAGAALAQEAAQPSDAPPVALAPLPTPIPLNIPAGPKWSSDEIAKIGEMLKGTWKSTSAVAGREGASSAEIVMSIVPIRTVDIIDALYVESARADSMHAPYRKALFQLYSYKGKVRLRTFEAITPHGREAVDQLIGFWAAPEVLPLLSSTTIKRADFIATLDMDLEPFKQGGGFSGKTPYPYPTGMGGAVEMTSEITLTPDAFTSSDRGTDASGKVMWGSAENEKYTFTRFNPAIPMVEKREGGLLLLWYKKNTEGPTLDESMRYYAHYTGWHAGGELIDSSRTRDKPGGPFGMLQIPQVTVGTIRGWKEALRGVGVGSNVRMLVPAHLAYEKKPPNRSGKPILPLDAPMIFEVEMVGLEPAVKPEAQPLPEGVKLVPKGGAGK